MPEICAPMATPLSRAAPPLVRVRQRTVSRRLVGSYGLHALDGRK